MVSELNFARRPALPMIHQSEAADSGLACVAMVAAYHGYRCGLNELRQRFPLSLTGATPDTLVTIGSQIELAGRLVNIERGDLSRLDAPTILETKDGAFVVLKASGLRRLVVHDPAHGVREWTRDDASKRLSGLAIEFAPSRAFAPSEPKPKTRLFQLWDRMSGWKRAIAQLLALSAILLFVSVMTPLYLQLAIDQAIVQDDGGFLFVLALGFAAVHVIGAISDLLKTWATLYFGNMMTYQIVGNVFRHLLKLPTGYFEKRHLGDILSRMSSSQPIQKALTEGFVSAALDGVTGLVLGIVMMIYSPALSAIAFIATAVIVATTVIAFPQLRARQEAEIAARAQEQSHLMETIKGASIVKSAGLESVREMAWRNLYAESINAAVSTGKWSASMSFVRGLAGKLSIVATVYLAGLFAIADQLTIGMIFAFVSYSSQFAMRAEGLVTKMIQFRMLDLHLSRIGDIVEQKEEEGLAVDNGSDIAGGVVFGGVHFRYGYGDPWTLKDVNFSIEPGEFVAITGRSGGGKTTLLKLILGLYPPTEGEVCIDGLPLHVLGRSAWRRVVGVVMQDDALFSGTIASNIASFASLVDMERVREAATLARVHDDIIRKPSGYLTLIGNMGSTLSGGQRQRILLARALYRRPRVLLLDEGTANLDLATERDIAEVVTGMPITRVVIAHRPELLRRAGRVLVMENGTLLPPSGLALDEKARLEDGQLKVV